ncbi:hypothetical protein M0811_04735 [Anaeramoeba ignava]|uniref:Transmembrane protein n=1 Tax=Anaeramoeba ignava TaxID=1746090 RepID=A0A9Q0LW49_ANAIG|nr:hypothetical protein M0811_04735 [Anaeramoeba ignava]
MFQKDFSKNFKLKLNINDIDVFSNFILFLAILNKFNLKFRNLILFLEGREQGRRNRIWNRERNPLCLYSYCFTASLPLALCLCLALYFQNCIAAFAQNFCRRLLAQASATY